MNIYNLVEVFEKKDGVFTFFIYEFNNYQNAVYVKNAFEKVFKNRKYEVEELNV